MAFTKNKLSFNRKYNKVIYIIFTLIKTVNFTVKIKLKKITVFCLLTLLFAGCQRTAIKAPESTAVKEETAQPAIKTAPEKQEPVQTKEKNSQKYMTGKAQGL